MSRLLYKFTTAALGLIYSVKPGKFISKKRILFHCLSFLFYQCCLVKVYIHFRVTHVTGTRSLHNSSLTRMPAPHGSIRTTLESSVVPSSQSQNRSFSVYRDLWQGETTVFSALTDFMPHKKVSDRYILCPDLSVA